MIQQFKDQIHGTKTCAVLSQNGEYLLLFSGEGALNVASMAKSAPKYSKITYKKGEKVSQIFDKANFEELHSLVEKFAFRRLDLSVYNQLSKEIQAQLSNAGFEVIQIYGIKINNMLYGYDMGFEFRFNEDTSFYVDFYLIHENSKNHQLALGFDLDSKTKIYSNELREFGKFTDGNTFSMKFPNSTPQIITDLLGSIASENISYLPNLSILIDNLYSDMGDNSFRVFKAENNELKCVCAGCLVDSSAVATRTREIGANLFKQVAINESASTGISSVASMKVLSAAIIESLGNIMLIETVKNGVTGARCEYIEAKEQFISQKVANNTLLNSIAWNAEFLTNQLGVARVISEEKLNELLKDLVGQQVSLLSNAELHLITSSSGETVGFLSAGNQNVVYENITHIDKGENSQLVQFDIKDNVLTAREVSNIAVDSVNVKDLEKDIECKIKVFESKCSAINFNDMQQRIADIDELVVRNFNALASLQASSKVLAARAKTILKAVDNILKFPMKTGYSGQSFGCLAEFIRIVTNADGGSTVSIVQGNYVPYFEELSEVQCGTRWITRNPDPAKDYENDIFVGPTYAATINDLKGTKVTTKTKEYVITDRQTRGSGKCEQEVIPLTKTEPRVVAQMNNFLNEIVQILTTLLNDEVMRSLKQVTRAVSDVTQAVKEYNKRRIPYQRKILEYFDAQNKLFFYNNAKKMILDYYVFSNDLAYSSEFSYTQASYSNEELEQLKEVLGDGDRGVINRITKALNVSDANVNVSVTNLSQAKNDVLRKAKAIKVEYDKASSYCASFVQDKTRFINSNKTKISEDHKISEPHPVEDPGIFNEVEPTVPDGAAQDSPKYQKYLKLLETYKKKKIEYDNKKKLYDEYLVQKRDFEGKLSSAADSYLKKIDHSFKTFGDIDKLTEIASIGPNNFNQNGFTKTFKGKGYCAIDFDFAVLTSKVEDFQSACKNLNKIYIDNKNKLKEAIAKYEVTFDGNVVSVYDTNSHAGSEFEIDAETFKVKYLITSTFSQTDNVMKLTIKPSGFHKKENYKTSCDLTISVGSLSYELSNMLKHEFIFGVLPIEQTILSKISYALLQRTDASTDEVYEAIKKVYGESIAQYYSGYANKIESLDSFFGCLIFAAIARIDLFTTTLMAFQEQNLGIVLQDKGFSLGNSSSFADEIVSIRI